MCMLDDSEPCAVYHNRTRRAIKPHRCAECNRTIDKGEVYWYATGLYDGYWWSAKSCAHCHEAARWLTEACGGYLHEAVDEDLGQHIGGDEWDLRSAPLVRLYRWMQDDWRDRSGELRPVEQVRAAADRAITSYRKTLAERTGAPR